MREPDFPSLDRQLQEAGVAPRYRRRAIEELRAHHEDLVRDLAAAGIDDAREIACQELGDLRTIGQEIARHDEFRSWYYRWPRLARVALPLACCAVLPLSPVLAGVHHAPTLLRWGFSLLVSALFTATLFAVLQFTIRPF